MNVKDQMKLARLGSMKLRARGMSTKPNLVLEKQVDSLTQMVMTVTHQRDELSRAYNQLRNERRI